MSYAICVFNPFPFLVYAGLACRENGVVVLDESRKGRMGTRSGRRGGDGVSNPRAYDGPFDVDECSDDDDDDAMDMEMDDPIGNPNDF